MGEKKFNCKMEDVPVIAGFVFDSLGNDKAKFVAYSPVFDDPFLANGRAQQAECYEIVKSGDVLKHQKVVKKQIDAKLSDLRVVLNGVEGYLKLANESLDIDLDDFGLKVMRTAISGVNVEKVISEGRSFSANLKRNETVLKAKGLTDEKVTELTALIDGIEGLNASHNSKKNERSRAADDSIKTFNELWATIGTVLDAGRSLFRGVDEVKLREYTMANLLKRVHNSTGGSSSDETPAADATK